MRQLKTFYHTFWKSLTSLAYYRDILSAPMKFSVKYFVAFSLILAVLLTIITSVSLIPPLNRFVDRFQKRALQLYPTDLVITVKDGQISTNQKEPLRFPFPYELFSDTPPAVSDQQQQYLITIDTQASASAYLDSKSLVLVTKDSVVTADDAGSYQVYPIDKDQESTLDKTKVDGFLNKILPLTNFLPFALVVLLFFVYALIVPITRLVSLIFLSLILYPLSQLLHVQITFKKTYQLGLHALTLPTLIQVILGTFDLVPPIPFFSSLLYLLYALAIVAELRKPLINSTTKR